MVRENEYKNIDSRQLRRFMRIPNFANSVSSQQLSDMNYRVFTATWQPETRIVYDAVQEGYTEQEALKVATGLTDQQIRDAIDFLTKKGYISTVTPPPVG